MRRASVLSPSESLREADVRLPSSRRMETTLQDLPFDLDFFESHCLSWRRSGCIHMIFLSAMLREQDPYCFESWLEDARLPTVAQGLNKSRQEL